MINAAHLLVLGQLGDPLCVWNQREKPKFSGTIKIVPTLVLRPATTSPVATPAGRPD
jgi:hypothetical protein